MSAEMLEIAKRILITVLLCGVIGWERERRNKFAGLRTHILVGVGSALIVLTSFYIFDIYKSQVPMDPSRIISNIVTGVGFLCAGAIIRGGGSGASQVIGLTTAATLWISSGIGMAVGSGYYDGATLVTVVVFFVLVGLRSIEGKIQETNNHIK